MTTCLCHDGTTRELPDAAPRPFTHGERALLSDALALKVESNRMGSTSEAKASETRALLALVRKLEAMKGE